MPINNKEIQAAVAQDDPRFAYAMPVIFSHEGSYQDGRNDPGGPTKYGISQRWLRSRGLPCDIDTIRDMSIPTAVGHYRLIWSECGVSRVVDARIATKVFDMVINTGQVQGTKLAQRACCELGHDAAVDGQLGPLTARALNASAPAPMMHALVRHHRAFYLRLASDHRYPERQHQLASWLRRADWSGGLV